MDLFKAKVLIHQCINYLLLFIHLHRSNKKYQITINTLKPQNVTNKLLYYISLDTYSLQFSLEISSFMQNAETC